MKRTIDVVLGDGPQVGTLRYDLQGRRENAAFEYAADWLGDRARFALGPALPLTALVVAALAAKFRPIAEVFFPQAVDHLILLNRGG